MNYILIPEQVDQDKELPDKAKRLYGYILRLDAVRNGCYAQNEYFCGKLRIHERQLQRYFVALRTRHFLTIFYKRDREHRITSRRLVPKIKIVSK